MSESDEKGGHGWAIILAALIVAAATVAGSFLKGGENGKETDQANSNSSITEQ